MGNGIRCADRRCSGLVRQLTEGLLARMTDVLVSELIVVAELKDSGERPRMIG
jgi:hypothetical protein